MQRIIEFDNIYYRAASEDQDTKRSDSLSCCVSMSRQCSNRIYQLKKNRLKETDVIVGNLCVSMIQKT